MTADLFTVREDDLIDLAASLMDWEHIRHVPAEDDDGHLVGLVTHRQLLRLISRNAERPADAKEAPVVRDIMTRDPVTVTRDLDTLKAIEFMRDRRVSCLPVVNDAGKPIGIVTERDFVIAAAKMLEDSLKQN